MQEIDFFLANFAIFFFFLSPVELTESNVGLSQLHDYNDIHVLDFDPNLRTLSIMSVLENNLNMTCLPQTIK